MTLLKVRATVRPKSLVILAAAANVATLLPEFVPELLVTSGNDAQHMAGSKHYTDDALDFRTKTMTREQKAVFVRKLRARLGPHYQVLLEAEGKTNEHLHVEYDPGMSTPIQTNAVDELELDVAEQLENELAREQSREDREQLGTYAGRKWAFARLERCGVFREIRGPIEDVYVALGRRSEGLELLARCQAHPNLFMQMWQEALKRRKQRRELVDATRAATRTVRQRQAA